MSDDDFYKILRDYSQRSRDWSDNVFRMDASLTTQQIYERLKDLEEYDRKDTHMSWNYGRNYKIDTRGDEVATALLEAYADGVSFETLIRKNSIVRQYWSQIQSERAAKIKQAEQEKMSLPKAAEKKKLEDAARAEVVAKLTPEELAAFGLNKKGYHR
ncbi:MAG: hypothetical protein WCG15_08660 [Actinomycetes bacterium]